LAKLRISHTAVELFQVCPKRYYFKNVCGINPVTDARPLRFGSAFHKALEAWWGNYKQPVWRIDKALFAFEKYGKRKELSPEEMVVGKYLIIGYDAYFDSVAKDIPSVEPEQRLVVPVLGLNGEPDNELELKIILDNEILAPQHVGMEHKTTASKIEVGAPYWDRVFNSQQLDTYFITAEYANSPLEYVIWDVVRAPPYRRRQATKEPAYYKQDGKYGKKGELKPGHRLHDESLAEFDERVRNEIAESPESFFAQVRVYPDKARLDKTKYDLWATGRLMLAAFREKTFPRNRQGCQVYSRECEYHPICFEGVNPEQSPLYTIRKPPSPITEQYE
jgi:hypothetical protein